VLTTAHDVIVTIVTSLNILFYHRRTVIRQMLTRAIKISIKKVTKRSQYHAARHPNL
jgi:hypothetical protein